MAKLDEALMGPAGDLIKRCGNIQFALESGFQVTLNEVTIFEFHAMQLIKSEQDEIAKERKQNA